MHVVKTWSKAVSLTVFALALWAGVLAPAPAAADANEDVVRSLAIEAELDPAGSMHVTETYEWDFGDREALGFDREILQRMDWEPDSSMVRLLEISGIEVSSPSGAPAEVWVEGDGHYLELAIGAPDGSEETRSGVQTYVLSYTIHGALNAIRDQEGIPDQDELYWDATGHESSVAIEEVTVSVTGPVEATAAACFRGPVGEDEECSGLEMEGAETTFTDGSLEPGSGLTVALAFPPGTFAEAEPIIEDRVIAGLGGDRDLNARQQDIARVTDPVISTLVTFWPLTLLAVLAAFSAGVWRHRHLRQDYQYAGLTPGVFPPAGEHHQYRSERVTREHPPTVAFTPPDGLSPAEVSYLWHKGGRSEQLSVTLADLAARGYLVISEAETDSEGRVTDWALARTARTDASPGELKDHEESLLGALFSPANETGSPSATDVGTVTLSSISEDFAEDAVTFNEQVSTLVKDRKLLKGPSGTRAKDSGLTTVSRIFLPIITVLALLAVVNLAVPVIPPSATALAMAVTAILVLWLVVHLVITVTVNPRTADGRVLYEQARGFKLYLETAEANQIRFEEDIDVFSRYLPYAMVFGQAERWAGIFEQLQAEGRYQPDTSWYLGHQVGHPLPLAALGASMSSFSDSAGTTLTASPGSAGGSGFSSAGGFAGGGVGGGGVGGR